MSARFWRWWWFGGKELITELWHRIQLGFGMTMLVLIAYSYGVKAGWWR